VREHIIRMSANGGCFIGASLSAADIVVYLYKEFLRIARPDDVDRDYFFLSKGHDVPALYGLFAEIGWLDRERLRNHLSPRDSIYWHPSPLIPGVEFHSGSLGHLLPVAVGVALDLQIRKLGNRVVVMTGDGELNEGSNWEAMLVASAYHLDNLTVVVDRNEFQANVRTEDLIPLEPLNAKFEAFGASTLVADGHDFDSLDAAFRGTPRRPGAPTVIIAKTRRGKGLPSIEARADRWFCNFSDHEVQQLVEELHGAATADLQSETLTVR
jgi:transketolase